MIDKMRKNSSKSLFSSPLLSQKWPSKRWFNNGSDAPAGARRLFGLDISRLHLGQLLLTLAIVSALATLLYLHLVSIDTLLRSRKTVAGHNLNPIPWQPFWHKPDPQTGISLFHCNYLSSCNRLTTTAVSTLEINSDECPSLFSSIHTDLSPWRHTRISRSVIEEAAPHHAAFRVVIRNGRLYVDLFYACGESRMLFTIWGFVSLLERYPGMVPDVDLLFDCSDRPRIERSAHSEPGAPTPPPVFRYCTTARHLDIPFPDWSFWGWPEVNIMPWDEEFRSIKIGAESIKWQDRINSAYWKGNPDVGSPARTNLLNCNDTETWRAQIFTQDWSKERSSGFNNSKLSSQCNYRYKIYAEGWAWSVSLKYIIACASPTLIVETQYQDFFTRGLLPKHNFWPVEFNSPCQSIKAAVEWGDENPSEAELIGKRGQKLMEDINMDRVYDYMFNLLVEYSKLLDFKPDPPPTAQEVCITSLLCIANKRQREFLEKSLPYTSLTFPCKLPQKENQTIN